MKNVCLNFVLNLSLLITGISAYYTCTQTKTNNVTTYRDDFMAYIEKQTTILDLRRIANESLPSIDVALRGWQEQVTVDLNKYIFSIDQQVDLFERKYGPRFIECEEYSTLMEYIYERRKDVDSHISHQFSYETKKKIKSENNKKDGMDIDKLIKTCKDNNKMSWTLDTCYKNNDNVGNAKKILLATRSVFCSLVNTEVEIIGTVGVENLVNVYSAIKSLSMDLDNGTKCGNYY